MVTENTVDMYMGLDEEWQNVWPKYYVSQPPHRDTLVPIYYKVMGPDGPVFWRREGDDTGRQTSMFDFFMEQKSGYGVTELDPKYTPWSE